VIKVGGANRRDTALTGEALAYLVLQVVGGEADCRRPLNLRNAQCTAVDPLDPLELAPKHRECAPWEVAAAELDEHRLERVNIVRLALAADGAHDRPNARRRDIEPRDRREFAGGSTPGDFRATDPALV